MDIIIYHVIACVFVVAAHVSQAHNYVPYRLEKINFRLSWICCAGITGGAKVQSDERHLWKDRSVREARSPPCAGMLGYLVRRMVWVFGVERYFFSALSVCFS